MSIADKLERIATIKDDIKEAIIAKGVDVRDNFGEYATAIGSISGGGGGSSWTGHADAAGLSEIGWDNDDIAYYQAHGVNWNAEDDDKHLVSDFDKWVATQITASNYNDSSWKGRVQYLPKIDTSSLKSISFNEFKSLIAPPLLDTHGITDMSKLFYGCTSLKVVPLFDTSNVVNMNMIFAGCFALQHVPSLDTKNVEDFGGSFQVCYSITSVPLLDTQKATNMSNMFSGCYALTSIPRLNTQKVTDMSNMFFGCSLRKCSIGIKLANQYPTTCTFDGESIVAIIKNANNTSKISVSLFLSYPAAKYVYEYSCSDNIEPWMGKNDGSMSAQTWLAAQAAKTNKPNSSYAITLSWVSGSSNYGG